MAKTKVELLENNKQKMIVSMEGISTVQANTIRRTILNHVPTMAIENVELKKNSSILYDEVIAHRLGLIVLSTDLSSYVLPTKDEIESDDYTARSSVKLTLKAKGPKTVCASDIKSKDPKVVPVFPKTPIVKLAEGQELEFMATAILGCGKEHAKWTPGLVWYTKKPKIKVNNNSKMMDEFREQYPPQIFDKKGKIDEKNLIDPSILDACEGICEDILKIEYEDDAFVFYIESWGSLSPKEMLIEMSNSFDNKLNDFQKALKEI